MTEEQKARDVLEHMGIERAQEMTAGDLVELANLINNNVDAERYRKLRGIALDDGRLDVLEYRTKDSNVFDAIVDAMER